jgi:trk system potassium uptake protein TrkH
MNARLVVRVAAVLAAVVSLFMFFPLVVALVYGEFELLMSFIAPITVTVGVAGTIWALLRTDRRVLPPRSGFVLVTLSWLVAAAVGSAPFVISGAIPNITDAFFESMSGFTTTGASILTEIESLPRSILFWRSLTHWLGGMGIIVLTVAILPLLGVGGLQLMQAEAPGPSVDKITPKIAETAKLLWMIYLGLTVVQTLLLMAAGLDLFDALTHTFGTLATGGFSPQNASVGHYDSAFVDAIITVFMVIAGVNFILHFRLLTGRFREVGRNSELRAYLGIFVLASLAISVVLLVDDSASSFGEALRFASFQAASILTTTGYATTDFELWPAFGRIILFVLMFIGGSAGSTGGGVKVVRIVTLFKQGINELRYLVIPHGVFRLRLNGKPLKKKIVYAISGFVFLYLFLLLLTTVIVASSGNDITTSLTTALATLGNIGPGFGRIGPTENYFFFPDGVKWYLSFLMMVGRLEIYTVLVLLTPQFWRR